jgi:hypothetical protein
LNVSDFRSKTRNLFAKSLKMIHVIRITHLLVGSVGRLCATWPAPSCAKGYCGSGPRGILCRSALSGACDPAVLTGRDFCWLVFDVMHCEITFR